MLKEKKMEQKNRRLRDKVKMEANDCCLIFMVQFCCSTVLDCVSVPPVYKTICYANGGMRREEMEKMRTKMEMKMEKFPE